MILIPESISANGWVLHEKCKCNMIKKYKFRHPDYPTYELEWWISYYQFKIMDGNTTKLPLSPISKADQLLKTL